MGLQKISQMVGIFFLFYHTFIIEWACIVLVHKALNKMLKKKKSTLACECILNGRRDIKNHLKCMMHDYERRLNL